MNIQWNTVTWYSKVLALIFLLVVLPIWTFYLGMRYEEAISYSLSNNQIASDLYVNHSNDAKLSSSISELVPTINLIKPAINSILKEGENVTISWSIENLPKDKLNWTIIGSVRCDPSECGRTGKIIFSYKLSENPGLINWKIVPPTNMEKFRGSNKNDYRNYGLDSKSIPSSLVTCLVKNGAEESYVTGFGVAAEGVSCSDFKPITILFDPPLSY